MRPLFFIFSLCLPILSAQAQGISERARDWWVTCNDRLYCVAETNGKAAGGDKMVFKLERSNKENAKIYVTVAPEHKLALGMRVDIDVLGLDYGAFGTVKKVYKGNEMAFAGTARRKLISKLREGNKGQVTVKFGGDVGTVVYNVSLLGVSTALLKMDQVQQRLDREDAAIVWGGAKPNSLSQPLAPDDDAEGHEDQSTDTPTASFEPLGAGNSTGNLYKVSDLPDAVSMLGFGRPFDCKLEQTLQGWGAIGFGLANGHNIYQVPCQQADINVPFYIAMTGPKHGNFAQYYDFETPPGHNQPNHAYLVGAQIDADKMQVTGTQYFSSNYDCGIFERHQYDVENDRFELIEYRRKVDCDGVTGPPEGFPLEWTIDEMGQ